MKRGTPDHPKSKRLARTLGINRAWALGILEALWHWAGKFAQIGDVGRHDDRDIAEACFWNGKPTILIEALVECGWLERCPTHRLIIHDWSDHADGAVRKYVERNKLEFVSNVQTQSGQCLDSGQKSLPAFRPSPEPKPLPEPKPDADADESDKYHLHARAALAILSEASGKKFRETDPSLMVISARLKEPGVDIDGVRKMILRQCKCWLGTSMAEYLRPETLFRRSKFDGYYAAKDSPINEDKHENRTTRKPTVAETRNSHIAGADPSGSKAVAILAARKAAAQKAASDAVAKEVAGPGSDPPGRSSDG
jgi:uncharacterized phage protein (TIGR02220 family)